MTSSESEEYLQGLGKRVQALARQLDALLMDEGCNSYVKTIYIGYDIGGEMVAALYGHADHVEVALALPESEEHHLLVDATHLTWRTMPVAAIVRTSADAKDVASLIRLACERVRAGAHDVHRDNEFFVRAKRGRRQAAEPPR